MTEKIESTRETSFQKAKRTFMGKILACENKIITTIPLLMALLMLLNFSAGAHFGYNVAIIGVSLQPLVAENPGLLGNTTLGATNQALFGGLYFGGLIFGPTLAPIIIHLVGYKLALIAGSMFGLASQVFSIFSVQYYMLIVGRFGMGLSAGVCTVAATEFSSGLAPPKFQGLVGTMFLVGLTTNILLANCASYLDNVIYSWRLMLTIALVPTFLLFVISLLIPESPVWRLGTKGKEGRLPIFRQLRILFCEFKNVWKMFLCLVLIISFLFGGVIPFINYLPYTLDLAGLYDPNARNGAAIGISFLHVLTALSTVVMINYFGRKVLLGFGYVFMFIATFTSAFIVHYVGVPTSGYVVMALSVFFLIGNDGGVNSIIFFLFAELFDRKIALVSSALMFTLFNIVEFIIAMTYLPMLDRIGLAGMLWMFSAITVVTGTILMIFLPETRQKIPKKPREEKLVELDGIQVELKEKQVPALDQPVQPVDAPVSESAVDIPAPIDSDVVSEVIVNPEELNGGDLETVEVVVGDNVMESTLPVENTQVAEVQDI
jgi:MFS family permease